MKARNIQRNRFGSDKLNGHMEQKDMKKYCTISDENKKFMEMVIDKFALTARSYDKVLKVSRTIADLAGEDNISKGHLLEAVGFRKQ